MRYNRGCSNPRTIFLEAQLTDKTVRYWLKRKESPWHEVTKLQYMNSERAAGFTSKFDGEPATAGFFNGTLEGRMTYGDDPSYGYGWDAEFQMAVKGE